MLLDNNASDRKIADFLKIDRGIVKRLREKKELKEKIKEDKKIQKEKEKKILEESLMKIRLNYEQINQSNVKM